MLLVSTIFLFCLESSIGFLIKIEKLSRYNINILMTIYLFFHFSDEDESDTTTHEAVFSQRCIESYFRMNSMACLKKFDVPVNFANLAAANKVLSPGHVKYQ